MEDVSQLIATLNNEAVKKYDRIKAGVKARSIISKEIIAIRQVKTVKTKTEEPKKE